MKDITKMIEPLIDSVDHAIISSVDIDGYPNIKAMLPPRKRIGLKQIFFSTNTSSLRVKHYSQNPKACVYFSDSQQFKGLMLKGIMEVLHDAKSKEMIWRDGDEIYYSEGISDPDYCVLKFTAQSGRYYSNFMLETFVIE